MHNFCLIVLIFVSNNSISRYGETESSIDRKEENKQMVGSSIGDCTIHCFKMVYQCMPTESWNASPKSLCV